MPFAVRHLPGKGSKLIDEKIIPQNTVFFNPSAAHPILYIRKDEHSAAGEMNSVFLYNLQTTVSHTIASPTKFLQNNINLYKGLEDLRICWYHEQLWFTGTCTHASANMTSELVVGHFDAALSCVERMSYIDIGSKPVKNVCPFVHDGKLRLLDIFKQAVYDVITCDNNTSDDVCDDTTPLPEITATKTLSLNAGQGISIKDFRGSTSPVHLHGNTWGAVVHDFIHCEQTSSVMMRLSYMHYWIEFDVVTGMVTFASSPFWLIHWGIEYVSGIHMDKNKNEVILYLGVNDTGAFTYTTTLHDLRYGK